MRDDKVVIPINMKNDMTERIHRGHQGAEKCMRRASMSMWWPGMRKKLKEYVERCNQCIINRRMKYLPMETTELPRQPWDTLG